MVTVVIHILAPMKALIAVLTRPNDPHVRVSENKGLIWEFPKIRAPYFGVLIIRTLLFRVLIRVPYNRKFPYSSLNSRILIIRTTKIRYP